MEKVKNKVRFTSLDTAAVINDLQFLVGLRVTNIYDVNPTTYVLKMAKSEQKHYLLIQNGVRFHTTPEKTDQKKIPSGFTMKFRKYLRSKRLQGIRQVGVQRVVVLSFGTDAFSNHLILELYAQGNIILTDNNFKIIQCIRSHEFKQGVKTAVGSVYPFQHAANIYMETLKTDQQSILQLLNQSQQNKKNAQQGTEKKKKKKQGDDKVKDIVFKAIPCLFPLVIEHILVTIGMNPDEKVNIDSMETIMKAVNGSLQFLKEFLKNKQKGYIFYKERQKQKAQKGRKQQENKVQEENQQQTQKQIEKALFEYSPFLNRKYISENSAFPYLQFSTFNESVMEYYEYLNKNPTGVAPQVEGQQFQEIAWKKYDQIKKDQDQRMQKLKQEQQICEFKAKLIEKNIQDVDVIIKIVATMEDNGCSWKTIESNIWQSKHNGNPYANIIHAIDMSKRQVTVLLGDPHDEEQHFQLTPVQINIDYNAFTNATIYYESKKKTGQKQKRTKEASQQVLKLAEKDALKKIQKKKNQLMGKNIPVRKSFWFEKFYWFMSSQGFLVISGRDSHQNELLVKRYMKSGDLYMHSDYGGAASTVIKNPNKGDIVPRNTLQEAATFTVCRSKAWQTKILSGSWWVHSQQVSKSAPTGQYLPTGSFMIRGKRNFIYPNRMEMGLTFLYKLDAESMQKHAAQRKNRQIVEEQEVKKVEQVKIQQAESQEFAIISLQQGPGKKQRAQQQNKKGKNNAENLELKKRQSQQQQQQLEQKQALKDSEEDSSQSQSSSESHEDFEYVSKNKEKKNPQQQNKAQKGKPQDPQQQPKQKVRNKKKMKKLEKYLQQQDEEQREIIMKMIGAREMKHMKQEQEVNVPEQVKDKKSKKNKKDKKKGLSKYMKSSEEDEQGKADPQKVLFLKEKEKDQDKKKQQFETRKENKNKQLEKQKPEKQKNKPKESVKKQAEQVKPQKEKLEPQTQKVQQSQKIQTPVEGEVKELNDQNQDKDLQKEQEQQLDDSSSGDDQSKQENQEQVQNKTQQKQQDIIDEKTLDSQLAELLKLVGKIGANDKFEHLVPMCAPYQTVAENRFKIKLVPGGLKKGKAARNIVNYYLQTDLTEQEKPMLRGVPEQQIINCLIGNVKLAGAGLLKLQMKEKAQKKQNRKQNDKKK